jgi:Zn-dependent M16 (insulinase) family peptidase
VRETLKLEIAFFALAGSAAGPMRKALIDAGLGKDLFPSAPFDADARQAQAAIGLRGTDADKADAIEALILSTLEKVVAEGLDAELIEAAFHHVSFHTREITPPFPLMILYRVNPPWYFGADPKSGLSIGHMLDELRAEYEANPGVFVQALRRWLLDNPHRLTAIATPDPGLVKQWEAEFAARMEALRATLDDAQVAQIKAEAETLKAEQDEPDSEEALASLPSLALDEIPRRVLGIPTEEGRSGEVLVLAHPVFSNGIAYVGLSFDTVDLSDEEAALLPFLGKATTELGAAGLSYEQMARRIARHTGGLSASPLTGRHLGTGARFERLTLDAKLLPHDADAVMGILRDVLLASDTSEHKRLKDLVLESASRSRARLQPSGHAFAYTRAAATLDAACWRTEQWSGVTQLKLLTELAKEAEGAEAVERLGARLKALQQKVFVRARAQVSLAGDPALVEALRPKLDALLAQLPQGEAAGPDRARVPEGLSQHTGVLIGGQMHYVAQVLPVPNYASPAAPALELMAQVLSNDLLYNKLRVQGGAYGGFSFYLSDLGLLPLVSYRDPNLAQTLQVYASVGDYLRSEAFGDEALDASRIGTIGSFDKILSPAQMLGTARKRRFMGLGDEQRAAFRDGLFSVGAEDVRRLALPHIEAALASAPSAALAPRASLEAVNPTLAHPLELFSLD